VAADVDMMPSLLQTPLCLYEADDAESLENVVVANIASPKISEREIHDWEHIVQIMNENFLESLATINT
jgi:hypothetical protein